MLPSTYCIACIIVLASGLSPTNLSLNEMNTSMPLLQECQLLNRVRACQLEWWPIKLLIHTYIQLTGPVVLVLGQTRVVASWRLLWWRRLLAFWIL